MYNSFEQIAQLKKQIERKTKHPFLMEFIEAPVIDEDKLFLFYLLFKESNIPDEILSNYVQTVMLVQIALDTHENKAIDESADLKCRQLTVLAGDYYSGLYYYLLAKLDDIPMIKSIASAITSINENKMNLYRTEPLNIEHIMSIVHSVESNLIKHVAQNLKLPIMEELFSEMFFLKRLLKERLNYMNTEMSILFTAISDELFSKKETLCKEQKNHMLHVCDRYIVSSKEKLETLAKQIPSIHPSILVRIEELQQEYQFINQKVKAVEEG
jgi:heptaprenyl diphosphate synthase